ncbi:MAG: hypothetical protein GXX08_00560 [Firmicutes bacterium]|nr:hypothetical protein [Bacillota bacterium]
MGNNSTAQLIIAPSTGAVVSSPHSMQGLLSSAICGSAPSEGGVLSRFEEVLLDAQLNAGKLSQTSHLRLSIPRSVGTEGEAAAVDVRDGGRGEKTNTGLAGQAGATELLACLAGACAGPAETICAELIHPDLTAPIGECSEAPALDSVDATAPAHLARQAYFDAGWGPGFEGSWLGPGVSVDLLAKAPATGVAGDARPTELGIAAGQPVWPKPLSAMQSGQPSTGAQSGGAFGPGGFAAGRSALGSNPMQTPAIGLSPMAVGAPGEHLPGPDGVIQQATVESMDPVGSVNPAGLSVFDSAMQVSVSVGAGSVELDPLHAQVYATKHAGRAAEGHSAAQSEPRAEGRHVSASSTDPAGRPGQVPQTEVPREHARQAQTTQAGEPARSAAAHVVDEAVAARHSRMPGHRSGDLAGLDARGGPDGPAAQESTSRSESSDQAAKAQNALTPSARQVRNAYEVEHGSSSRQRSASVELLDSALIARATEISSRQQRVFSALESNAMIDEAAVRRQSNAAEPQTVSAASGDVPPDTSGGSMQGAMRESAVARERGTGGTPLSQAANASALKATNPASESAMSPSPQRTANAAPERAMSTSSGLAPNTSSEREPGAASEHQPRIEAASSGTAVTAAEDALMMDRHAAVTRASGTQSRHQGGIDGATEAAARTKSALNEEQPEQQTKATVSTRGSEPIYADARLSEQRIETGSPETATAQRAEPRSVIGQIVNRVALSASEERPTITVRLRPERLGNVEVQVEADRAGRIVANINAETHETLRILRSSSHQLMASLRAQGLQVSEVRIGAAQNARADTGDEDLRHQFAQAQHNDGSSAGFQAGGHSYLEQHWQGRSYQPDVFAYWRADLPETAGSADEPIATTVQIDLRPGRLEFRA